MTHLVSGLEALHWLESFKAENDGFFRMELDGIGWHLEFKFSGNDQTRDRRSSGPGFAQAVYEIRGLLEKVSK